LTTYTNPRGNTTSYQYDLLNRLKRVTSANQEKTDYTYNRLGNLNSVTQTSADGTETVTLSEKEYDERGLLTEKTQGSPLDYTYSYNSVGLLAESTDGNLNEFSKDYDSLNRMVTNSGDNSLFESYYGYRPFGPHLIQEWDGSSLLRTTAQEYDAYGNVSWRQIVNDSQATVTYFEYDPLGRVRSIEHPNAYNTLYTYDKTQVQRVQTNGQTLPATSDSDYAQYEYYPNGMLYKITYPKLDDIDGSYLTSEFEYDDVNRLLSVINKKESLVLSSYSYTYDENGNILSQTNADGTTSYTYDLLDRLETIQYPGGGSVEYTYDLRGNRITVETSVPPLHYGEINYTYNVWDQLTSADNDGTVTTFEYEPQGMRIKKTNPTETIRYTYDHNGRVIAEADASFAVQANYVWGPDRLLQKRDTATGDRYYYLYNGHGDVVQIVDQEGEVVNEYEYDEWGNITNQIDEGTHNPFKYAGEIYDDETGLYYLRARYYDPSMGRFINKDSFEGQIDNPLTLNLYTYVHNNPLTNVDPTGHWCEATVNGDYYSHPGPCNDGVNGKERYSGSGYSDDSLHSYTYVYNKGVKQYLYVHPSAGSPRIPSASQTQGTTSRPVVSGTTTTAPSSGWTSWGAMEADIVISTIIRYSPLGLLLLLPGDSNNDVDEFYYFQGRADQKAGTLLQKRRKEV